jgi:hypothetical protein
VALVRSVLGDTMDRVSRKQVALLFAGIHLVLGR